jgi:CobQ-like glutamine amidotransferase family enzyme
MANLTILHLYPSTLHLNGEAGNVLALKHRAELAGLKVNVKSVEIGEELPKVRPHLVFIGSGTLQATLTAAKHLVKLDRLIHRWVAQGTKVLAVGTGFDLVSQGLILADGNTLAGLGLTNTTHRITGNHLVGEVVIGNDFAGFINSDREISRVDDSLALGLVKHSDESKLVDYLDGYSDGKIWATNVQGPFLPMNPRFADEILGAIFPKYVKATETRLVDSLASKARKAISSRIGH